MQTGAVAERVTAAAHSTHPVVSNQLGQIVIEDTRLRNFREAARGALAERYDFAVTLNGDGDILRVRTLVTGKLDVAYATPGDTLSWTTLGAAAYNGSVIPDALAGGGVAVFSSSSSVDVFFQSNATTIKRIRSSDKGHTFPNAAETVKTLTTQQTNSLVRMAAPVADLLFFTNSPANVTANTSLNYAIYSGGAWGASVVWDLGYQPLGIHFPVPTPDNASFNSTLGAIQIGTNDYLLVFYAAGIRGETEWGVWSLRVRNVGGTPQWGNPQKVWATYPKTIPTSGVVGMPPIYCAFPKLQTVGSEYWITAVECSQYNSTALYHFNYFRSPNGVDWTMGDPLAGTDADWLNGDTENWGLADFVFGQILVSSMRTFFFGYDVVYVCPSTSLVGQINSARRFDATGAAKKCHVSLPEGGDAVLVTLDLKPDVAGALDAKVGDIVVENALVTLNAGYRTSEADPVNGSVVGEEVTAVTLSLDRIPELFTRNKATRRLQLSARDHTKRLINAKPTLWWSYNTGRRFCATSFHDASAFKGLNGNVMPGNGTLNPGSIDPNYSTVLDNSAILPYKMKDGWLEIEFQAYGSSWSGLYVGVIFGVIDHQNYYAVIYSRTAGKFALVQCTPTVSGVVIHQYGSDLAVSNTVSLSNNTKHKLYVRQLHNRLIAIVENGATGTRTKVIDYTGVPTLASYWGIVFKGAVGATALVGNALMDNNYIPFIQPDFKTRADFASRFTAPAGGGYLRSIRLFLSVGGPSQSIPDLVVGVIKTKSDGSPQDIITNPGDIVWSTTINSTQLAGNRAQSRWHEINVAGSYLLDGSARYCVWIHPANNAAYPSGWDCGALSNEAISNQFPVYYSTNAGETWTYYSGLNSAVLACQVGVDANNTGVALTGLNFAEDAPPQTFERIATNLCVKARVMTQTFGQIIADAFAAALDVGADGTAHNWANNQNGVWANSGGALTGYNAGATTRTYLRSNSYWGSIGDIVLKCKLRIEATGKYAGFLLRGGGSPTGGTFTGYTICIGTQTGASSLDEVIFTKDTNNAVITTQRVECPVAVPIATWFDVLVVSQNGYYQLFINDMLAGSFYDAQITANGYVGFFCVGNHAGGAVARWDDFAVSDLATLRDQYTIAPGTPIRDALRGLIGNDRVIMQMRYDGAFVASRFAKRSSVDTYSATAEQIEKIMLDEDRFSQIQSSSPDAAMIRSSGDLLDRLGEARVHFLDFPEAQNEQQAFDQATVPLRQMRERVTQFRVNHAPVFTAEREDVGTLQNGDSGESSAIVIKSMEWEIDYETKLARGSLLGHSYVD